MALKKKPFACKLSLLGSLTTFLVAERIGGMFGWAVDKRQYGTQFRRRHLQETSSWTPKNFLREKQAARVSA
jgi:hypothetical protein